MWDKPPAGRYDSSMSESDFSPSGVRISRDFRSNLIIDRYDPVFADMRASKIKHLRSVNSEDAITWNVFRSLRQIDPAVWLPELWSRAFTELPAPTDLSCTVKLWETVAPPLGLLVDGDEGASEIDVMIESATWVWFIEAKHRSDISTGTTTRPERDQVIRNLDVGSYYAGVRRFYFSLLVSSAERSPIGLQKVEQYRNDLDLLRRSLGKHRPDQLINVSGVTHITWMLLGDVLRHAEQSGSREDERLYAARALDWMRARGHVR
jgi:hypothetical protein